MTVHGYLRVSTDEQARSGLGLDAQRATIAAAATGHGCPPDDVQWCADDGVSGSVPPDSRPCLGSILGHLGAGDVLIAAKLDRLGRSALDVLLLAERARREGWDLVVCDLGLDTSTPVGNFSLQVMAAVAELEREMIRQRTRDALAAAKARGQRLGRPVELQAEVRDRIAAMRDEGTSYRAIADQLTADGAPTARGGRWHPATVKKVVDSIALDAQAADSSRRASTPT